MADVAALPSYRDTHVRYGSYVILKDISSGHSRVECVDEKVKEIRFLKKFNIPVSVLVGLPFGATLRQNADRRWVRCQRICPEDFLKSVLPTDKDEPIEDKVVTTKRSLEDTRLIDDNTAQKLSCEDVIQLKASGTSNVEVIKALIEGSESFQNRTVFAQEKYILKKLQRHTLEIAVLRCDFVNIMMAYGSPLKVGGLRIDYLGSMLNEADVHGGRNVMVFDHSVGLLTAATLSRMGGLGTCFFVTEFKGASSHIVGQSGFTEDEMKSYREISFNLLADYCNSNFDLDFCRERHPQFFAVTDDLERTYQDPTIGEVDKRRIRDAIQKREARFQKRKEAWEALITQGVDSVLFCFDSKVVDASNPILAANLLSDMYKVIEKLLKPGGRLVGFSSEMQPLGDVYTYMKARKHTWACMRFEEQMLRRITTQPGRSHPQMDASHRFFEGFLMSASRMNGTELDPTPP